jgi:hypothetical protein
MKAAALIFDTDFTAEMHDVKLKDGKIQYADKEWVADKTTPFQLKTSFGMRPLYLLKWNSLIPIEWAVVESEKKFTDEEGKTYGVAVKDIKPLDFKEIKWEPSKVLPAILRQSGEMKFMRGLKGGGEKGDIAETIGKILPIVIIGAVILLVAVVATQTNIMHTVFGFG